MSSFIFNNFKQRFLNGTVPSADTWNFTLMNKNFTEYFGKDEYPIEQYTTLDDFYLHNAGKFEMSHLSGVITNYTWYKPDDTDEINKPMFITSGEFDSYGKELKASNWEKFKNSYYYGDISGNSAVNSYLASGGFYYIRTKDELRWFANRSNSGNNRIIGVIGDGIDGVIHGQIGKEESYPFEGILDGNGHTFDNLQIICDNVDNGIIGVLGRNGTVRNFQLENTRQVTNLVCKKRINIQHIKDDGRDVNAGMLVGRNYGTIENINARPLGIFKFSGFVPEVYSVTNKADNYTDFSTIREKYDQGENFYYLNSWCINSPGNCCPYVGYFAEGILAETACNNGHTIEAQPARKSRVSTGLVQAEFNLKDSSIKAAALYVKDYRGSEHGSWPSNKTQSDPWIWTTDDKLYGRNAVAILAYDIPDTVGTPRRVWVEIHGMAYDKKSGTGKRRYHFMPGHINANFELNAESTALRDFEKYPSWNYKTNLKNRIVIHGVDNDGNYGARKPGDTKRGDWDAAQTAYICAYHETPGYSTPITLFINARQTWSNNSFGDDGESSPDYVCTNDDIEVYSSDGTPGMVISQTMSNTKWSQRNKCSSSSVWDGGTPVIFHLYLNEVITWDGPSTADPSVIVKHGYGVIDDSNGWPHYYHYEGADVAKLNTGWIVVGRGKPGGDEVSFFANMPDGAWECLVNRSSDGKIESHNLDKYFALRYSTSRRYYSDDKKWVSDEPTISNKFAGELIYDGDWCWDELYDYMKHRSRWLDPGHKRRVKYYSDSDNGKIQWVFRKNDYDDITINGENAKDNFDGTVEVQVIEISEFQYRPFVHGNYNVSDALTGHDVANPGQMFGNLSAKLGTTAATIDYMCKAAKMYALNPNYYGLDQEGRWTSQAVRPYYYQTNADTNDKQTNYINYNWNIFRKQWEDWEDPFKQYDNMQDYDSDLAYTWLDKSLIGACDIPHSLYGVPVRMHDMGRAAYYISPIAGSNFGKIQNVIVSSTRENAGNFVGFVGSIAGKQERGEVLSSRVWALDHFHYYENKPEKPNSAKFTTMDPKIGDWHISYQKACEEWSATTANYNYEVRYKTTPIIPEAIAGDNSNLVLNPDDSPEEYKYYPRPDYEVDEDDIINGSVTYYDPNNASTAVVESFVDNRQNPPREYPSIKISSYKCNPLYTRDLEYAKSSRVLVAFTSAWYNDYDATATNVMDDTITFKLKPIFNAGGLFGKYVPVYSNSVISHNDSAYNSVDSRAYTRGTSLKWVDVIYGLSSDVPQNKITAVSGTSISSLSNNTHDLHNSYGAIAGCIDLETTQVGQNSNEFNKLSLNHINISSYASNHFWQPLPFGFLRYQPTELNTVQATEGAGRGKGRCWHGIRQNTTFALDWPIMSNRGRHMEGSTWNLNYAAINQSSAAFFSFRKEEWASTRGGHMTNDGKQAYFQSMLDNLIAADVNTVNLNTKQLAYFNKAAFMVNDGSRGPESLNAPFGTSVAFTPAFAGDNYSKDKLLSLSATNSATKSFYVDYSQLTANAAEYATVDTYVPNNIDCLKNTKIFNRPDIDDLYFYYSYTTKSAERPEISFQEKVQFTSAARDNVNLGGSLTYINKNINIGYAFSDSAKWEGDGFQYRNNFLRIGDSVSPNCIRERLKTYKTFDTSSVSAIQHGHGTGEQYDDGTDIYVDTHIIQSAEDKNQYGGILVTDSKDRCVMWIENENGVRLEGNPYAIQLPHVKFQGGNVGGLVMAIKGSKI